MPATNTKATNIPGVVRTARTVVTKPATRTASTARTTARQKALADQTQQDIAEFRRLKAVIDAANAELEEVRGRLLGLAMSAPEHKLLSTSGDYVISLRERSSWTYSDDLNDRLIDLKADQKKEQSKGIAINNPTHYIDGRAVATK
jgi:hypothetical protein